VLVKERLLFLVVNVIMSELFLKVIIRFALLNWMYDGSSETYSYKFSTNISDLMSKAE
jgi:hypothetical protein